MFVRSHKLTVMSDVTSVVTSKFFIGKLTNIRTKRSTKKDEE